MLKNTKNNIEMTFKEKPYKGFGEVLILNSNEEELSEVSVVATSLKFPEEPEVMAEIDVLKPNGNIEFIISPSFGFVPPYNISVKWKNKEGKSFSSEFEKLEFRFQ